MWITYNVLLYAGQELPKIYNWMLKSEFFAKLKYQILQTDHMRLQPLAVNLMYEMCRVQSLKPCDLGKGRPFAFFSTSCADIWTGNICSSNLFLHASSVHFL